MITDSQAHALMAFHFGADLDQVDLAIANTIAKLGFVAWTITPFRTEAYVTVEGVDALVEWLANEDLARWMGLLPDACPVTVRSATLPEMNVTVRLFDEGVEARQADNARAYRQACVAERQGCAWAGPWLRGWNAAGEMAVAS